MHFFFSFLGFKGCDKSKRNMLNKLNKGGRKLGAKNDYRDNRPYKHKFFLVKIDNEGRRRKEGTLCHTHFKVDCGQPLTIASNQSSYTSCPYLTIF
jgi:hypothetical protein